jgi:Family of unknown function (DUF6134)
MQRRDLVLGAMGSAAGLILPGAARASGLPVPPSGEIGFRILHSGKPVGEQHLTFTQTGDLLRVDNRAALVVRLAGIPIFHYACIATEHWSGTDFCGVDSKVNHNGTLLEVHASPITGGFAIQSTKAGNYTYTGEPQMMPLTYWNKALLDAMILNIETGRHYPAIVNSPGWNYLATAEGGTLLAQRFDVTGKLHLSVWYDQYEQWAGLEFNIGGDVSFLKFVS